MRRSAILIALLLALAGCQQRGAAARPPSYSVDQLELAVDDLMASLAGGVVPGDSGELSAYAASFASATAGTPLATDAQEIQAKVAKLEELLAVRAARASVQAMLDEIKAQVAAVKAKQ